MRINKSTAPCQNSRQTVRRAKSLAPPKREASSDATLPAKKMSRQLVRRRKSLAPQKKPNDAIPVQKKRSQTVGKLVRRREVSRPPKEAKRRNPRPKRCQNSRQTRENSWQTREKTQSLPKRSQTTKSQTLEAIPVQKGVKTVGKLVRTVGKLVRRRSLSPKEAKRRNPKRLTQSPSKKVSKQSANS